MSRHLAAKQLSMYLDDEVQPDDARRIERHLDDCEECRARLDGLRRVVGGLQELRPVAPPKGLGLELQRQLARATPPFGDRSPIDRHRPSRMLQPAVLGSLGIVLALAIIMLLLLQALERNRQTRSPERGAESSAVTEEATVLVGDLLFRHLEGGWVEVSIGPEEARSARSMPVAELDRERLPSDVDRGDVDRALQRLEGDLILRLDGEVVRLVRD